MVLNGFLLAIDFSIDPKQDKLSRIESIAAALLRPGEVLPEHLAPGHGEAQIVGLHRLIRAFLRTFGVGGSQFADVAPPSLGH
jgi:hypothetical protein